MIDHQLAGELFELAAAIARMRPPQNNRPEAFHEDRSELAARTRRLAERCRTGEPTAAADVPAPVGRQATSRRVLELEGRSVLVLTRRHVEAGKAMLLANEPPHVR